jgi:hypothetical protein
MITARFKAIAVVLALAFCVLVPVAFNNWFLGLPVFILCAGLYEIVIVLSGRSEAAQFDDGAMKYSFYWGIFTVFIGLLTLVQVLELIWVLMILMAWLTSVVPFFSMRQRNEAGGRDNMQVLDTIRR